MIWQHIYKLNFFFFCVYLSCIETAFISVEKVFVCLNLLEHSRTRLQRATVTEFVKMQHLSIGFEMTPKVQGGKLFV